MFDYSQFLLEKVHSPIKTKIKIRVKYPGCFALLSKILLQPSFIQLQDILLPLSERG